MLRRLVSLAALLLTATAAAGQTPAGLVGRWRVVEPLPPARPGAEGRSTAFTFAADGSAEIAYESLSAAGYRLAAPLELRGDTLAGVLLVEDGRRDGPTRYDIALVGDDLALRHVPSKPAVSAPAPRVDDGPGGITGGGPPPAPVPEPEPPRDPVTVLDFTRVDGAPGSLVGSWALASSSSAGLEVEVRERSVGGFTFSADSLTIGYRISSRYTVRRDSLVLYRGDAPRPDSDATAFRLGGDAMTIETGSDMLHLARVPDATPAEEDPSAVVGRWVPADPDAGTASRTVSVTLGAENSYVSISERRQSYVRDFESVAFSNGPGERADVYTFALNEGMLRLSRGGRSEPLLFARASGEPEALVGRWTAVASGAEAPGGLRALTLGADGVASFEYGQEQTFRLVDGRFEVSGSLRDGVHETDIPYRYRLRYRLDGGTLTLSQPIGGDAPLRLRRDG